MPEDLRLPLPPASSVAVPTPWTVRYGLLYATFNSPRMGIRSPLQNVMKQAGIVMRMCKQPPLTSDLGRNGDISAYNR